MSTPNVDLRDVHELSLEELDAVAGGYQPSERYEKLRSAISWIFNEAPKAIGQDVLAFAASQGVR